MVSKTLFKVSNVIITLQSVIFDALSSSITNFPTTSRPVADNCRKLCLSLMDGSFDNRFELIEKASSCLATIFLTGTNANRPEIWKNTAFRLLGTANRSLDRLFDTIDEGLYWRYMELRKIMY